MPSRFDEAARSRPALALRVEEEVVAVVQFERLESGSGAPSAKEGTGARHRGARHLKKPPRISPRIQSEVRCRASPAVQGLGDVRMPGHPTQRLLRLDQQGFACLAVAIDLFSRRVVGRSLWSRQTTASC